ncbi:M48 family metalloprotease [Bacillus lacus]|uniref:M48 family metalloprotease n=1 Tax=Metabacillus lacus TaxID=1983721 RepID=A0A7X2M1E6_9BACI|nr:ankyrin repeat domain-containing protein [Metabacillus lacus]MRX74179.1 M48 family metalloprotease [Metabacillus lacus]
MEHYIYKKERIYFVLLLLVSIPLYALLTFTFIGIPLLVFLLLIPIIMQLVHIGYVRGNGVKITAEQFPEMHQRNKELSEAMGLLKTPDMYVIESGGMLNAFATRFFGKNMVVLYSDLFEMGLENSTKEIEFVIAHELAHIKRNHILKFMLILPGNWIPFLGTAYTRACEYTCDGIAAHQITDPTAAEKALTLLASGKVLYQQVDIYQYMKQASMERNFFVWLSEVFSSHPPLPKRIFHVRNLFHGETNGISFKTSSAVFYIFGGLFLSLALIVGTVIVGFQLYKNSNWYANAVLESEESTPLMLAAYEGDLSAAQTLLLKGEDPNAADSYGNTALFYAATVDEYSENDTTQEKTQIAKALIENGADVTMRGVDGYTPLHLAVYWQFGEIVMLLLQNGADVDSQDDYGNTPLHNAVYNGDEELIRLLIKEGSNPQIPNSEGLTAADLADEEGIEESMLLLE